MAGIKKRKKFFGAISEVFKRHIFGTPTETTDLDARIKAQITFEEVNPTDIIYDCEEQDPTGETETGKLMRVTITYAQITARILAGWLAYLFGIAAVDGASQTNEIQTHTGAGTGTFQAAFDYDGKAATSAVLPHTITAAEYKAALEAMDSIRAGNITSVTGTLATGFVVTFGGRLAHANIPLVTFINTGMTGGSVAAVQTAAGSNKTHSITRSTDDSLPLFALLTGFKADSSTFEKFYNCVCDAVALTLNRRRDVGATITIIGRFTPEEIATFTVPDCPASTGFLHGSDTRLKINSQFVTDLLNAGTVTFQNQVPTDDDLFPFDDIEIAEAFRGEKPLYPVTLEILGSKGDTNHTIAKNKQTVPLEIMLGTPADRVNLIFPQAHFALASNRLGYTTSGRSFFPVVITPYKDESIESPVRVEAYLADQTTAFLTT